MPNVKLSKYECARGVLPNVCMRCGAPSDTTKVKSFSWFHPLIYLVLLAGLLPFVIVALVLTKRMTVHVPLCHEHRGHWAQRSLLVMGTFLVALVAGIGAFLYHVNQPAGAADDWAGYLCIGSVVLLLIWLILAVIVSSTAIRATEITDRSIKLAGVADSFVAAVEDDRDRDREDNRHRRRQYDDVRDDYDDEPDDLPQRRRPRDDDDDDRPRRRSRE